MDWEQALRARLLAAPTVTAFTQQISWEERPQGSGFPAITLQIIVEPLDQTMAGLASSQSADVQVDVWSLSYAESKALKDEAVAVLLPRAVVGGISFDRASMSGRASSERTETQLIFRRSLDFTFRFSPA